MRELFFKVIDDTCNINEVRRLVDVLPERAIRHIDRRAEVVIPKLFPGETADEGFRPWAKTASRKRLIQAVRLLSYQGVVPVSRSRGPGKRSRERAEPVILGVARGAGRGKDKGGRPRDETIGTLITHVAMDFLLLSGGRPIAGRSDGTPFGDLVHSILRWEGVEYERAEYALRQYLASSKFVADNLDLPIADKPSTALDVTTQAEIMRKIKRVEKERGLRLILMTYDLGLARTVGDRVYVLRGASLTEVGGASVRRE
jgi:hypothetical protein